MIHNQSARKRKIIARYTDEFPDTLFHICDTSRNFVLRDPSCERISHRFDLTLGEDAMCETHDKAAMNEFTKDLSFYSKNEYFTKYPIDEFY